MGEVQNEKESKKPGTEIYFADKILAAILAIIVVVMFFQVVFRYVFNNSITWSEELIRYLFVWITFFGAALCFRDKMNIGVDFFLNSLPEKAKGKLERINLTIMLLFTVFLLVTGVVWVFIGGKSYGSSIPIQASITLYSAIPIACVLIVFFLLGRFKSENRYRNNI